MKRRAHILTCQWCGTALTLRVPVKPDVLKLYEVAFTAEHRGCEK